MLVVAPVLPNMAGWKINHFGWYFCHEKWEIFNGDVIFFSIAMFVYRKVAVCVFPQRKEGNNIFRKLGGHWMEIFEVKGVGSLGGKEPFVTRSLRGSLMPCSKKNRR